MERRVPPHNLDAEASVLGGVLLRNEALNLIDTVGPEHFYDPKHREVFTAMKSLEAKSRPIDPVNEVLVLNGSREGLFLGAMAATRWAKGRRGTPAMLIPSARHARKSTRIRTATR